MKLQRWIVITLTLAVICASSASGFDSRREGFVVGLGGGFSPATDFEPGNKGYYFILDVGYAINQKLLITLEANALAYPETGTTGPRNFRGLVGYYYLGPQGKSFFATVGGGILKFSSVTGPGLMVGGGYEFISHFQAGAYVILGRTSNDVFEKDHLALQFALTGFLY